MSWRPSFGAVVFGFSVGSLMLLATCAPKDNSDNPVTGERSGMQIRTDHLTGCEYLTHPWGGVTRRMKPDGTQVCHSTGENP